MKHFTFDADGKEYINSYSKGETLLGRMLSNFYYVHRGVHTPDGVFSSVEGYWYFLSLANDNPSKESLRYLYGGAAKTAGVAAVKAQGGRAECSDFEARILAATKDKVLNTPDIRLTFEQNELPVVHYYNMHGRLIRSDSNLFQIQYINTTLRSEVSLPPISGYLDYYPTKKEEEEYKIL